ncbi:MAG: S-adenosylmethionine:tRNA ribosyltransferase-isomerase [Pseudomonadota bacterium]|jgi:S-adenosylmethionine:tRNA ribosyltransferase-isomerase
MHAGDFDFHLPPERIAQSPLPDRTAARLLCLDGGSGEWQDRRVGELPMLVKPGDLLVLNDTRVIPARLFGTKPTGGAVELLIERIVDERRAHAHLKASKFPRPGTRIALAGGGTLMVGERRGDLVEVSTDAAETLPALLERVGHIPLPPYIDRPDTDADRERYQTVFAARPGAVAAPTAGLHFDQALLDQLVAAGVRLGRLTLHVGAGTFQPVRAEQLAEHRLHAEQVEVGAELCAQIAETRARGGRVVAVGTTVVRALETAAESGVVQPYAGETRLFIHPGRDFRFRVVDALMTNFHLPRSTLLMLVCAFAGRDRVLAAYAHAVAAGYRFYSYGDAMWITPASGVRA